MVAYRGVPIVLFHKKELQCTKKERIGAQAHPAPVKTPRMMLRQAESGLRNPESLAKGGGHELL